MFGPWVLVKGGEYPVFQRTEECDGIECDHCKRIVPVPYVDFFDMNRDGHHDGRDGKYAYCRDVWGFSGTGMLHRACRKW